MAADRSASVLVVGAGPVGLTLAAELARHGVVARIIDKAGQPSPYCRAIGITPRTLEVFEDMGVVREIIDGGLWLTGMRVIVAGAPARDVMHDFSDLNFSQLGAPQYATEAALADHLGGFGITVERQAALTGLQMRDDGVDASIETPGGMEQASFRYVIGCDGAHSTVRKSASIAFEGEAFPIEFMLGDVHIDWDLPRGMTARAVKLRENGAPDLFVAIPLPERGRYRVTMQAPAKLSRAGGTDHGIQEDRPGATLADLQEVADRLMPGSAVLGDMRWFSIFRISMRLAQSYAAGHALLAGDAAHIHPPTGGQGMNTGIQDAYNLAWKLALVLKGMAAPKLLDSYEAERRPVAAEVIARTTEQSINLGRDSKPPNRLQDTQLLVTYRDGPLSRGDAIGALAPGDRVPDVGGLRRAGIGFPLRLFEVLRGPRPVLIVRIAGDDAARLEAFAAVLNQRWPGLLRVVAVVGGGSVVGEPPGVELLIDSEGRFDATFSGEGSAWLVRPDNYLGFAAARWSEQAILDYLQDTLALR